MKKTSFKKGNLPFIACLNPIVNAATKGGLYV
jgi:hypothetical protein